MGIQTSAQGALEFLLTPSTPVFVFGLAVVLLVPILLHFYLARSTAYITLPSILIVGPPGAGKTALVTRLERRADHPPATYTSQTPNVVELAVGEDAAATSFRDDLDATGAVSKKFLLIDTPGHGKLRGAAALARLQPAAAKAAKLAAVVFVVDSAALPDETEGRKAGGGIADAAAYLYDVLLALQKRMSDGRTSKAPSAIPVLVAANKADLFTALPAPLVKAQLETELSRLRSARSRGLLDSGVSTDDDVGAAGSPDAADEWLGEYGSATFIFEQMREFDVDVDVVAGNIVGAPGAGPGIDKWWTWMADKI